MIYCENGEHNDGGTMSTTSRTTGLRQWIEKESVQGWLMMAPNTLGLCIFYLIPIISSILLGFFRWNGLSKIEWVGFDNFAALLHDASFFIAFRNTFVYTLFVVPSIIICILLLGLLLAHEVMRLTRYMRTLYFLPLMTMPVAAALVWKWLLNLRFGLVNKVIAAVGLSPIPWLSSPDYILVSIMLIGIWLGVAYDLIIIISGLKGIPKVYYEAAVIDGVSPVQKFFYITLPLLTPSIFFIVITQLIGCLQVFDTAFIMLGTDPPGTLRNAGSTIVMSIYENGFVFFKMGYSSAQAFILFLVVLVITIIQFRVQKRWVHYA